jgi:hypothetical protein
MELQVVCDYSTFKVIYLGLGHAAFRELKRAC